MVVDVWSLPPRKLKELKFGDKITIRHAHTQREANHSTSRIIHEQFPKNVAIAFSTKWASMFPSHNQMSLAQMSSPMRTSITIIGGSIDVIQMVLTWMLFCCEGNGMQSFSFFEIQPFFRYFVVKEVANNMGISSLSRDMDRRLTAIARKQIHSEDVRAMYLYLPPDHPMLRDIGTHVAELIWHRQLKASGAYRTLRKEIPGFDANVNKILDAMVRERQERRLHTSPKERRKWKPNTEVQATNDQAMAKKPLCPRPYVELEVTAQHLCGQTKRCLYFQSQTAAKSPQDNSPRSYDNDNSENPTRHKEFGSGTAHKSQQRRPITVSASLTDAGGDKDDFFSHASVLVRPRTKQKSSDKKIKKETKKFQTGMKKLNIQSGIDAVNDGPTSISTSTRLVPAPAVVRSGGVSPVPVSPARAPSSNDDSIKAIVAVDTTSVQTVSLPTTSPPSESYNATLMSRSTSTSTEWTMVSELEDAPEAK